MPHRKDLAAALLEEHAVRPEARSRMNTAYMVASFVGGAIGSYGGAWGWSLAGWGGVCLVGLALTVPSGSPLVVAALVVFGAGFGLTAQLLVVAVQNGVARRRLRC